jgi:hypothetical protein
VAYVELAVKIIGVDATAADDDDNNDLLRLIDQVFAFV